MPVNIGPSARFTDTAGACAVLGLTPRQVGLQVAKGQLIPVRVGNADAYTVQELRTWAASYGDALHRPNLGAVEWMTAGPSGELWTPDDIAAVLGISPVTLQLRLTPRDGAEPWLTAVGNVGRQRVYRREDVDNLLARVAAGVVVVDRRPAHLAEVRAARAAAKVSGRPES